jgi:hypothetical protein
VLADDVVVTNTLLPAPPRFEDLARVYAALAMRDELPQVQAGVRGHQGADPGAGTPPPWRITRVQGSRT